MKVMQVLTCIQAESDGVSIFGRNLSLAMDKLVDLEVHVLDVPGGMPATLQSAVYPFMQKPRILSNNGLGYSPAMSRGVKAAAANCDILHAHSLWMMQLYYSYKAAKNSGVKFCIHPHGTLSAWALSRSKLKKKLSTIFFRQKAALRRADLLFATCRAEYEDIRNYGLSNPVAIIPNGIDFVEIPQNISKKKQLVFLSRIHPKKGIDLLLKSWESVQAKFPNWELKIAGNDQNEYANLLKQQIKQSGCKQVELVGEINGDDKFRFLSEAAIFVLPTHSENFGIAIGEALACGTPVITTTGAPWGGLVDNDCGLWIDLSVENLTAALVDMMSRPLEQLSRMGENGREWVRRNFSWEEIAKRTVQSYQWVLNPEQIDLPEWIYVD